VIRDWFRAGSAARFNVLTIQCFNVLPRFRARPLIGSQYRIEIRMRNACMPVHDFLNDLPNARKVHLSIQECGDRDFVHGV
jgi:hypothetical protein